MPTYPAPKMPGVVVQGLYSQTLNLPVLNTGGWVRTPVLIQSLPYRERLPGRTRVKLDGEDLAGLNLSGVNFPEVRPGRDELDGCGSGVSIESTDMTGAIWRA